MTQNSNVNVSFKVNFLFFKKKKLKTQSYGLFICQAPKLKEPSGSRDYFGFILLFCSDKLNCNGKIVSLQPPCRFSSGVSPSVTQAEDSIPAASSVIMTPPNPGTNNRWCKLAMEVKEEQNGLIG